MLRVHPKNRGFVQIFAWLLASWITSVGMWGPVLDTSAEQDGKMPCGTSDPASVPGTVLEKLCISGRHHVLGSFPGGKPNWELKDHKGTSAVMDKTYKLQPGQRIPRQPCVPRTSSSPPGSRQHQEASLSEHCCSKNNLYKYFPKQTRPTVRYSLKKL